MSEEFDYEKDLEIDPDFLDAEWLNHPKLFMKYAKESARANAAAKLAEEKVKIIRSELSRDATDDPDRCLGKGVKPTVTAIESYYRGQGEHKKAKKEWVDACYYADLLAGAVSAFQARKLALENLVKLHGQNYFASPQEPHNLPEASKRLNEQKANLIERGIVSATNRRGRR